MNIEANLREYLYGGSSSEGRVPTERHASFDYCFNYFQSFREDKRIPLMARPDYMELSCLQLAFYLASWGMLRGSSPLLRKSARFYAPLIEAIASADSALWEIDTHCYTPRNIELLLSFSNKLRELLPRASDNLVSKIMLGVFGSVPAFDTYFTTGFGVAKFNRHALERVGAFYADNAQVLDRFRIPTLDFATGRPTQRVYTRAKVIDMVFFIEGWRKP